MPPNFITMRAMNLLLHGIENPTVTYRDSLSDYGEANIRECIEVVLRTELRERIRLPEFGAGLGRFLFEPNTAATRHRLEDRILRSLAAWEPRIAVESVDVAADPDDAEAAIATIEYKLVATQVRDRITVAVALAA